MQAKNPGVIAAGKPIEDYDSIKDFLRPNLLVFAQCKKVLLQGVTFQNSPAWCLHPLMCEDLTVRNVQTSGFSHTESLITLTCEDFAGQALPGRFKLARMKPEKFNGTILSGHKQQAAVEVPFNPAEKWSIEARKLWPGRHGHVVQGKLNGVTFYSCIVPRQKRFYMLIDQDLLLAAGVSVGDTISVAIQPDNEQM